MTNALLAHPFFQALADEHRRWLAGFNPQYLANWEKNLRANEEAALAEAGVRRLLQSYDVHVEPNEELTGAEQRPDFHCVANGSGFEVEVTHISIEKATEVTGLPDDPTVNFGERPPTAEDIYRIRPLNGPVFWACVGKAKQCADAPYPTVLAVATFHYGATVFCFDKCHINELLTGVTHMRISLDTGTEGEAYHVTDFGSAVFLRPDSFERVGFARNSISALLLCGLKTRPPTTIAVLHPNPARPFNPASLPQIEFGGVSIDRDAGQLYVTWPQRSYD